MILHVTKVEIIEKYTLLLTFNNGITKKVNLEPLLEGKIFKPLKDPNYFAKVSIDEIGGTIVWPNEADFAPEALYELETNNI